MKPIPQLCSISCLLFSLVALSACKSTIQNANQLRTGLTKDETIAFMGQPTSVMSPGQGIEICRFRLSKSRAWKLKVPEHTDYLVRFVNGHVDAYGAERELRRTKTDLTRPLPATTNPP